LLVIRCLFKKAEMCQMQHYLKLKVVRMKNVTKKNEIYKWKFVKKSEVSM